MLYTVVPLERIYNDMNLIKQEEPVECKVFYTKYGTITTNLVNDEYIIDSIRSTNMEDYLNPDYQPGEVYTPES